MIHLPLAEATLLQFMHPVFTVALAAGLLGERIGRGIWFGIPLAVAGVLLVVRPAFLFGGAAAPLDPFAVAVALSGAFFAADAYVTVRHLARTGENPLAIVFSFPAVTVALALPLMLRDFVWPEGIEWLWLALTGATAQAGQMALTRGIQLLPASRATAYSYTQIVFASLLGAWLFGESPDAWTAGGAALVLARRVARGTQRRRRLARRDGLDPDRRAEQHGGAARDVVGLVVGQHVGVHARVRLRDRRRVVLDVVPPAVRQAHHAGHEVVGHLDRRHEAPDAAA